MEKILYEDETEKMMVSAIDDRLSNPCIVAISNDDKYIFMDAIAEGRLFYRWIAWRAVERLFKSCRIRNFGELH